MGATDKAGIVWMDGDRYSRGVLLFEHWRLPVTLNVGGALDYDSDKAVVYWEITLDDESFGEWRKQIDNMSPEALDSARLPNYPSYGTLALGHADTVTEARRDARAAFASVDASVIPWNLGDWGACE